MKSIIYCFMALPLGLFAQYQVMSVAGVEPNQTIVTRYDKGFVIKNSGERMEGNIQLKVKKSDTVEVRFKGEDGKKVFSRNTLKTFGLLKTASDYREAKTPGKNFHPGTIVLKNGKQLNGRIAIRGLTDAEEYSFFYSSILLEKADNFVSIIPAEKIKEAQQHINGKTLVYENYKNGILQRIVDGPMIVMRNPFPTTARSGLNNLVNQAADSVAKEMAERSLERHLGDAVSGDAEAQDQIAEDLENARELSNTDARFMQNEYLIKTGAGDGVTIIQPDNFDSWVAGLKANCAALSDRRDLMKYNKIYALVRFYNTSCH